MNDKRYQWILYVIVFVILGTIGIQVFWNYKNYLVNKQQLINDVQHSLDNAVEGYYAHLAENKTIAFAFETIDSSFIETGKLDSIVHKIEFRNIKSFDPIDVNFFDGVSVYKGIEPDSCLLSIRNTHIKFVKPRLKAIYKDLHIDSSSQSHFRMLTSKIILSLTSDTLLLEEINNLLKTEFERKKLDIDYRLSYLDPSHKTKALTNFSDSKKVNDSLIEKTLLSSISKSAFLPNGSILKIHFTNTTKIILSRILSGILISIILVLAVISCLFYLLRIIKHQKQLAEVKNDLISNITHEFKTPIATISVALESIKNFKVIDNKEKTKKYLDMSSDQLEKLNVMVEKLLETATLDSESLELNKESVNIVDLLNSIIDKHQIFSTTIGTEAKKISFNSSKETIMANVDVFHFENAINNIIDNAIKYGGEIISINLKKQNNQISISISDNGNTLTKANKEKIFEKFYRVSKGNAHDVKGFGIGLYYAKKIIEKHGGVIHLNLDNNLTTFKLSLPNE